MTITLTCSCGRQLAIGAELAGRQCRCQACGQVVQVPAMGIVEGAERTNSRAAKQQIAQASRRRFRVWPWLLVLLLLMLVPTSGILVVLHCVGVPSAPDTPASQAASIPEPPDEPAPMESGVAASDKRPDPPPHPGEKPPAKTKSIDLPVPPKPVKQEPPAPAPPEKTRPQPVPPKNVFGPPLRLEWRLRQGDKLFQDLRVVQKPSFIVQGIPITSSLQYRVVSSFTVEKVDADKVIVRQKIESGQLLEADPLTQGLLAPMIAKLPGTEFTIEFDARMDVIRFTGAAGKPQMGGLMPGVQGLQMASLLDADGWKELAQLTFFQPNRALAAGAKWTKPLTHNWGALGNWTGKANYVYLGRKKSLHEIDYALQLTYQAPKAGGLVADAAFRPVQAGGAIIFDADKGKVVQAQERFGVRGRLTINLLGQNTVVDLEEDQLFMVRILDQDPRGEK
jgi:hypothetical protein